MDVVSTLAQKIFVPLYERRWGMSTGGLLTSLEKTQFDDPEQHRERQWAQVRALLKFAYDSNPFYANRFRSLGLEPGDVRTWSDFAALPLLTKQDIRENADALVSQGYSRESMFHKRTGGSTGVPVHLYWDIESARFKRAVVKRHDAWAGYRLGMKQAALWGDTERAYSLKERLYMTLCLRAIFMDTLEMDEAYLADFVERLRDFRPSILLGHAHSLYYFTQYLQSQGVDDISFAGIISTAETLAPAERTAIESHFGKVLFDRYGCEELSLVASECEAHEGLHVGAECHYVEVLDGDEETPGRVVVTDLTNRGMPFLRYEVGDLATLASGRCSCGRGLPRLGRVFGRTSDILYAPDGRSISGISILDTFLIHVPGVRQAQIVQDAIDHIKLRVVREVDFDQASVEKLKGAVVEVFGPSMRSDLEYVDAIEPTPRGKFQFTICEIEPPR